MGFRSLTTRLIFWTLLSSGAVLLTTLYLSNRIARESAVAAAEQEARQAAERLASRVGGVLLAVEESAELLAATLETLDPQPPALEPLLRRFVASEQDIYGAAAAYRPDPRPRAPYAYGVGGDPAALRVVDLAAAYDYTRREWYRAAAESGSPQWSEPYVDEGASGSAMVTYSVAFREDGGRGRLRGVATADVQLEFLGRVLRETRVGRTGAALVLSRQGRILALSDERPLAVEVPMLDQLEPEQRERLTPLVRHMVEGRSGFERVSGPRGEGRMVFQPIGRAGWSLGVFYPETELMAGASRLRAVQLAVGLAGIALLALVLVALSRRLTAPLRELAGAARGLASNLDAELPAPRSRDELGALATAFAEMRDSLRRYVHDLEITTKAKQRLESELAIARRIQMDMLPPREAGSPADGWEISAQLEPARAVGGDLYDHFSTGGRVFFLVADVSGKGVPAALFMARAKTLFDASAARQPDPAEILAEVNRGLVRENEAGMYVTAVCGVLEVATGELAFACAGHEPPIHLRCDGPPVPFAAEGGTILGLLDAPPPFPLNRVRLAPGEGLVAYTDGIGEAFDAEQTLFGLERLLAALAPVAHASAAGVTERVRDEVRAFAGAASQSDDITILALRYTGRP